MAKHVQEQEKNTGADERFIVINHSDDPDNTHVTAYARDFPSHEEAKDFAKRVAEREQEDHDGTIIIFENEVVLDRAEHNAPNTRWTIVPIVSDNAKHRHCPHCGRKVTPSEVGDYRWTCEHCEEDFYDFECKDDDPLAPGVPLINTIKSWL